MNNQGGIVGYFGKFLYCLAVSGEIFSLPTNVLLKSRLKAEIENGCGLSQGTRTHSMPLAPPLYTPGQHSFCVMKPNRCVVEIKMKAKHEDGCWR